MSKIQPSNKEMKRKKREGNKRESEDMNFYEEVTED